MSLPPGRPPPLDVGAVFDEHGAFVHRVAQRLVGSSSLADDVVQDVFVTLHRRRDELEVRIGIRTFLYRTTVNVALRGFRSDRRFREVVARFERFTSWCASTPEEEVASRRNGERIRACIARLSGAQREVFELYEFEGLDGAEIAEILEIPVNTVWSRLRLARAAFRAEWEKP